MDEKIYLDEDIRKEINGLIFKQFEGFTNMILDGIEKDMIKIINKNRQVLKESIEERRKND